MDAIQKTITSGYFIAAVASMTILTGLLSFFDMDTVIVILNGLFFGGLTAIGYIYTDMIVRAILGRLPGYGAEFRQMVISMLGGWLAYGLIISASVYVHATDTSQSAMLVSAISRVLAIVSAIGQITAPNIGQGLLYGRDRKLLWGSTVVGFASAMVVILIQATAAFAWPL